MLNTGRNLRGKHAKLVDARLLLCCALFIDVLAETKNFWLKKVSMMLLRLSKTHKKNCWRLLRYEEKDPGLIRKLPTLKLIIDHAEANKDGEPHYQVVKLIFFFVKNTLLIMWWKLSMVECFNKHYGNTISETSKVAVNVFVDKGNLLSVKFLTVLFGLI